MANKVVQVLVFIVLCGVLPGQCVSESNAPSNLDESALEQIVAHLTVLQGRLEENFIARLEEKFLSALGQLEKKVHDQLERSLGDMSTQIEDLKTSPNECSCQQHATEVNHLINDALMPRIDNLENGAQTVREQTVAEIVRVVREETKRLEYTVNHPDVFRGGLWTMVQRRVDGSEDFFRNWTDYRTGFGRTDGEYWLGLEKLHEMVRKEPHELLVLLEDFDGVLAHAHYDHFRIGGENERYAIQSLGEYSGTAGDGLRLQEGASFWTHDIPQGDDSTELERRNCATVQGGAWWFWKYPWCSKSHLNGKYSDGASVPCGAGLQWTLFRGCKYSLKSSQMMIRRSNQQ